MEQHPDVPTRFGPGPVWLAVLPTVSQWRRLLADPDWNELIEQQRQPFGLFTASPDPAIEDSVWREFTDYCVQRELRLTVSGGDNSGLLEDLFDDAYLRRHVAGLPTAEPLTVSEDEDPLEDEFESFLGYRGHDLRGSDEAPPTDWVRVALVIGDQAWLQQVRATLTELSREP